LEYHLLLAKDLGYLPEDEYTALDMRLAEMQRMLVALARKVGQERKT
jgi:four helix bundle protein